MGQKEILEAIKELGATNPETAVPLREIKETIGSQRMHNRSIQQLVKYNEVQIIEKPKTFKLPRGEMTRTIKHYYASEKE